MKEAYKLILFYKDLINNDINQLVIRAYSLDEKFLFDKEKLNNYQK